MENFNFTPGSTISGIFDQNLKTPDPFNFVYLSHPFGAANFTPSQSLQTPSDLYESTFELMDLHSPILTRQNSSINFHCNFANELPQNYHHNGNKSHQFCQPREIYDIKSTFCPPNCNFNNKNFQNCCHSNHCNQQYNRTQENYQCEIKPKPVTKSYMQRHILSQDKNCPKFQPSIFPRCTPQQANPQESSPFNCYDQRNIPEMKFIFETLRSVWKTPVPLAKENKCRKFCCQNLPHKIFPRKNSRSNANMTPNTRMNLVRRYSLPEIEIRKFGVVQEIDSILRFCGQLRKSFKTNPPPHVPPKCNIPIVKTEEKSCQTNPVTITEKLLINQQKIYRQPVFELEQGPSYFDLLANKRDIHPKVIKKPETMPYEQTKVKLGSDQSFQNDDKKENFLETNPVSEIKEISTTDALVSKSKQDKIIEPEDLDNLVAEMLIKNLKEDIHIADVVMKVLEEENEKKLLQYKEKKQGAPIIEITKTPPDQPRSDINQEESFNDTKNNNFFLKPPEQSLSDAFEKLPPPGQSFDFFAKDTATKEINDNNKEINMTTSIPQTSSMNSTSETNKKSENISEISSLSLHDTFDTPTFPKSSEETPIDSLDQEKRSITISPKKVVSTKTTAKVTPKLSSSKSSFGGKKQSNVAEIQPIKSTSREAISKKGKLNTRQSGLSVASSSAHNQQPEKPIVLPQRKTINRPKINEKTPLDSLEQFTIDSKGNPNYRRKQIIPVGTKVEHKPLPTNQSATTVNSRYLRVSASSTTSRHSINPNDKLKKVTIFEAQSNMVTPDNEMGPKRFYQKTEIYDGDKKIDILEIVECLQSPFHCGDPKTPCDLYSKFSKIPIPVKKCCKSIESLPLDSYDYCCAAIKPVQIRDNCPLNVMKPITDTTKNDVTFFNQTEESNKESRYSSKYKSEFGPEQNENEQTKKRDITSFQNNSLHREGKENTDQYVYPDDLKTKSTENPNDSISASNDASGISIPNTMTANHGSTPRKKSGNKNYPYKTAHSKSSHYSSLLHRRSKRSKCSAKCEKRLLSNRKRQCHEIISVEPNKSCSNFKRSSTRRCFNEGDLNAWRIPSSDYYNVFKHPEAPPPPINCKTSNFNFPKFNTEKCTTESDISTTTICEKCRLCSCYTSTTFSDRFLYSPTLSVCSVCSQPITPLFKTPDTTTTSSSNIKNGKCLDPNCRSYKNATSYDNCKNKACLPLPPTTSLFPQKSNENLNCECLGNRFPKIFQNNDCPTIPEKFNGFMQPMTNGFKMDQSLDRFIPSSCSSFASSIFKSTRSHTAMPCINWKSVLENKKKPEIKIEPVKFTEDKINGNSVFTVTVKGHTLEKGTDLKMELCFTNPNKEESNPSNALINETDDASSCSIETIHERMLPEGPSSKDQRSSRRVKLVTDESHNNRSDSALGSEYNLNLSGLNQRSNISSVFSTSPKKKAKDFTVMGNAIAPEHKPKAPTMTEKDLTGRYRK